VQSTVGEGTTFKVRLFLPQLHDVPAPVPGALSEQARNGYSGVRRRILVVDNEEADRGLLRNVLQPLGFDVREAASGHDCIDLLTTGYLPDVVLLDLAMPGIDGWETLRRIRSMPMPQPHVAIVSANAFDKGLENTLGIALEDFLVKPLRHTELLDWLHMRLDLEWLQSPLVRPLDTVARSHKAVTFDGQTRLALEDLVLSAEMGHVRGVLNQLETLGQRVPELTTWCETLGSQARQFQMDAVQSRLQKALHESSI
jgi:CheY-like chemotaxis protein